jgi:glycosyltransferase involved in cell wall biosynthesis
MPQISVIIPAYNVAQYIGETLESVLAQTFADYEVIVVNDGSPDTDELERVLSKYRHQLIYVKQENLGAGAARNAGLCAASGEFVAFLDADDLWLPNFLAEQVGFLRAQTFDLVCADAVMFDELGDFNQTYMESLVAGNEQSGEVTFEGLIRGDQNLMTSAMVALRQPLIDAGAFDEALRNAQDFDLWIRLLLRGARIGYQRKALVRYRCREGSLSGDNLNRVNRELRVFRKFQAEYDLDASQRAEVEQAIRRMERELNLVLGKEHLGRREFAQALECFRNAKTIKSNWKLRASCFLLSTTPNVLTRLNSALNSWRHKRDVRILRNTR